MKQETQKQEQEAVQFAADEQTGNVFELNPEKRTDIEAATISVIYLIAMLVLFGWQFVDISTGRMLLLKRILHENADKLNSDMCRIIAYAVIGGGLGGIVNGFRSILIWHAERKAFGWRYLWKYITLPLLGATLAAIVYALTRAGMAVIGGSVAGGNSTAGTDFAAQAFSAFAIGALSGYGSQKVFKWLDGHINRWFQISELAEVEVPNLKDNTEQQAKDALQKLELNVKVVQQDSSDESQINKVVWQSPTAGTKVAKASQVTITVAKKKE